MNAKVVMSDEDSEDFNPNILHTENEVFRGCDTKTLLLMPSKSINNRTYYKNDWTWDKTTWIECEMMNGTTRVMDMQRSHKFLAELPT